MALIFNRLIKGTLAEFLTSDPTTKREGTIFETDAGDKYKIVNGMWVNQNPVLTTLETVYTKFLPRSDQTGTTFGDVFWVNAFSDLASDGSMLYSVKSATSGVHVGGYMGVQNFARPDLLPKIQVMFKVDNAASNSSAFVGLVDETLVSADFNTAGFIPTAKFCVTFGAKSTDTNWRIYHNDGSGALNSTDTGLTRNTDIYDVIIQYLTSTSVIVIVKNSTGTVLYSNTFTTEIPVNTDELEFRAGIINEDTLAAYGLYVYDHVYLEKRIPTPTGVVT